MRRFLVVITGLLLLATSTARAATPTLAGQVHVPIEPNGIAVDSVRHRVFTGSTFDVSIIDGLTQTRLKTFRLWGPGYYVGAFPGQLAVDEATGNVFVGAFPANIGVFDTNGVYLRTISTSGQPIWMGVDPVIRRLYVGLWQTGTVGIFDLDTGARVGTAAASGKVAVDASTHVFYATDPTNHVGKFSGFDGSEMASIPLAHASTPGVDAVNGSLYVLTTDASRTWLNLIDATTLTVTAQRDIGYSFSFLNSIVVDPGNNAVFVAGAGELYSFDLTSLAPSNTVRICWMGDIAADTSEHKVFMVDRPNNSVAVVDENGAGVATDAAGPTTTVSPVFAMTADSDGLPWSRYDVYLSVDCFDALTGCFDSSKSADGGAWTRVQYRWQLEQGGEGRHVVRVRSTDCAGNVEDSPGSVAFGIDGTPPTGSMTTKTGAIVVPAVPGAGLEATSVDRFPDGSEGSGVVSACFNLVRRFEPQGRPPQDEGCFPATRASDGSWHASPSVAPGTYDVSIVATDLVGNRSRPSEPVRVLII